MGPLVNSWVRGLTGEVGGRGSGFSVRWWRGEGGGVTGYEGGRCGSRVPEVD